MKPTIEVRSVKPLTRYQRKQRLQQINDGILTAVCIAILSSVFIKLCLDLTN